MCEELTLEAEDKEMSHSSKGVHGLQIKDCSGLKGAPSTDRRPQRLRGARGDRRGSQISEVT